MAPEETWSGTPRVGEQASSQTQARSIRTGAEWLVSGHYYFASKVEEKGARFGSAYTNTGTMQRRLAWPPRKDDPQIREALPIFKEVQMGS